MLRAVEADVITPPISPTKCTIQSDRGKGQNMVCSTVGVSVTVPHGKLPERVKKVLEL